MSPANMDLNSPAPPARLRRPRPSWAALCIAVALAAIGGALTARAATLGGGPDPAPAGLPGVAPVILQAPATGHAECQVIVDDGRVSWAYCRRGPSND